MYVFVYFDFKIFISPKKFDMKNFGVFILFNTKKIIKIKNETIKRGSSTKFLTRNIYYSVVKLKNITMHTKPWIRERYTALK